MHAISDKFGRSFKTLRVSLTNSCNATCSYCVDPTKKKESCSVANSRQPLNTEQYLKAIESLNNILSLNTVRLTGGEPTLYHELEDLIKGIHNLGIKNIKMTSNGILLSNKLEKFVDAGLSSLNLSLDTINIDAAEQLNQKHSLKKVLDSLDKALLLELPVKVNAVVNKGKNDQQTLVELFNFCKSKNVPIRFLELMKMGHIFNHFEELFVSEKEILKTIKEHYSFSPIERTSGSTANYWNTEDGYKFGVISNFSKPFCDDCNRLRLDSYGNIYGCLSTNIPINIANYLDNKVLIQEDLTVAIGHKKTKFSGSKLSMKHIGG